MTDTTAKTDISSTAERATTVTTAGSVADLPGWEAVLHTITSRQRRRFRQLLALVGTAGIVLAATTAIVVDRAQRSSDRAAQDNGAGRLGPEPTAPAEESNEPASTTTSLVPVTTLAPTEGGIENQIFAQQQYEPLFVEHIGRYTLRFFSAGDQMFAGMFPGPFGMPGVPVEKGNGPVEPVQPAADCFPRQLAIQISDEQLATQVHLSVGGDPRYAMMTGGMSTLLQPIGIAERAPAWVAVVPVLPTQRAAKIAFPNGVVVDATVRDGLAIAILSDDSLDWRSMNSAPSTKIDLGEGLTRPRAPRIAARDECRPPPGMFGPAIELPAPGEQPRDVLAATAAIEPMLELAAERLRNARVGEADDP